MYKRQAHPFSCTHDDLIRTGQGPYGHRFLVFSAREDYAPIVDDYAQGEFRQGVLYTLESLGDLSGHQYQRIYRMENGKLQESGSYGYFSSQRRQLNGPQLCIGLCQSVKLGLVEEAMGLLTPSLREQIDGSGLAGFIGNFHDIRPLYRENGSRVALTLSYHCLLYTSRQDGIEGDLSYEFLSLHGTVNKAVSRGDSNLP